MPSTKVKGVVLGGVNVKEKDKLVYVYTLEKGKISVSMRGVRGDKAKLKSAKEPFSFCEFVLEEGRSGYTVTSAEVIDNFYALTKDLSKFYEGSAILDVVSKVGLSPNPMLFIELVKALKTICYDNVKKYYVIDKFLMFVFEGMGYGFLSDKCSACGGELTMRYFNFDVGEIVCPACKSIYSAQISNATYSALRLLKVTAYENLSTLNFGGQAEIQAYNLLSQNYNFRTGYKMIEIF
jgi:DNA repair protein RecO (recombination protein O)